MTMFTPLTFLSLEDVESFSINAVSDTAIANGGNPPEDVIGWLDGIPVYAVYTTGEPEDDGESECTTWCTGDIPRLRYDLYSAYKAAPYGAAGQWHIKNRDKFIPVGLCPAPDERDIKKVALRQVAAAAYASAVKNGEDPSIPSGLEWAVKCLLEGGEA